MPEQVQMDEMLKLAHDIKGTLATLAEKNGQKDGIPNMDAITKDQFAKMRDDILSQMDKKLAESKVPVEAPPKEKKKASEIGKGIAEFMFKAKYMHPDLTVKKTVMSEGTDAQGGYTVPTEYSDFILGELTNPALAISQCTMFPHAKGFTKNIPKWLTDLTVYWVDEAGVKTSSKPTFTTKQSVLKKMAVIVTMTDELLADNIVGLESELGKRVARAFANELERVVFIGDVAGASDAFNGINKSSPNSGTQAGANLAYGDIVACINNSSMLEEYRIGASMWMNRTAMGLVMGLVDLNNRPLWNMMSINGQMQNTLLGVPIQISSKITNTCGTGGASSVIFYGNLENVLLGFHSGNEGIALLVSNQGIISSSTSVTENLFTQDETAYRWVLRRSVVVANPSAFTIIDKVK